MNSRYWNPGALLGGAIVIGLAVRILFGIYYPGGGGDTGGYLIVAENIARNFCVSFSDPESANCVPHWGGNQLPGYPAFLALVQSIFGPSTLPIIVLQSLLSVAAISRLTWSLMALGIDRRSITVIGTVLFLSPLNIVWHRYVLTESLAITVATWVFAELFLSFAQQRLRILGLALPLVISVFLRWDGVLLALPVACAGIWIHGIRKAVVRGVLLCIVVGLPLLAWGLRSLNAGLPALPNHALSDEYGSARPVGYIDWMSIWMVNQFELQTVAWPMYNKTYSRISIPDHAYVNEAEKNQVSRLLKQLEAYDGSTAAFPEHIDAEFSRMADIRRAENPFDSWVGTPIRRQFWLWLNPYTSLGWPSDWTNGTMASALKPLLRSRNVDALFDVVVANPLAVIGKGINVGYRWVLLFAVLPLWVFAYRRSNDDRRRRIIMIVGVLGLLGALSRGVFFGLIGGVESRYMVEAYPGIELMALVAFLSLTAGDGRVS